MMAALETANVEPLVIARQGSFAVGGRLLDNTTWVDQMYVQYQVPVNPRIYPLLMVHGGCGTGRVWESTPDGRDGYQTIWRFGPRYPDVFSGCQFPTDPDSVDQFFQSLVPTFSDDEAAITDALVALLDKIGPVILITHSQSGRMGWFAAIRRPNLIKAIVSNEPTYVFPDAGLPESIPLFKGTYRGGTIESFGSSNRYATRSDGRLPLFCRRPLLKGHGHFCWRYKHGMLMIPNYGDVTKEEGERWIHWSEDGIHFAPIEKSRNVFAFGFLYVPYDPLAGEPQTEASTTEFWGFETVKPPSDRDWDVERIEWRLGDG